MKKIIDIFTTILCCFDKSEWIFNISWIFNLFSIIKSTEIDTLSVSQFAAE